MAPASSDTGTTPHFTTEARFHLCQLKGSSDTPAEIGLALDKKNQVLESSLSSNFFVLDGFWNFGKNPVSDHALNALVLKKHVLLSKGTIGGENLCLLRALRQFL